MWTNQRTKTWQKPGILIKTARNFPQALSLGNRNIWGDALPIYWSNRAFCRSPTGTMSSSLSKPWAKIIKMRHVQFNYTFVYVSSADMIQEKWKVNRYRRSTTSRPPPAYLIVWLWKFLWWQNMPVLFDANRFDLESLDYWAGNHGTQKHHHRPHNKKKEMISLFRLCRQLLPYTWRGICLFNWNSGNNNNINLISMFLKLNFHKQSKEISFRFQ